MAGMSYIECKDWEEVEDFCKKHNLNYIEGKIYATGIAKAINKYGHQLAYLVTRNNANVSSIKDETKWIWILE
jgi:hypothetical protein